MLPLFGKGSMELEAGLMVVGGFRSPLLQLPDQPWTHGTAVQGRLPVLELACMAGSAGGRVERSFELAEMVRSHALRRQGTLPVPCKEGLLDVCR